jgi:protein-disulfide isomerase
MKTIIAIFFAVCCFCSFSSYASDADFSKAQVGQIETIVHDYLLKNPHVLIEVAQKLQEEQVNKEKNQVLKIKTNIEKYKKDIFDAKAPARAIMGNPHGKVILAEVLQYPCLHCKFTAPMIERLIKDNPDLKVIVIQWPFFGNDAIYEAKLAFAAEKQGKFHEVHSAFLNTPEMLTKDAADKIINTMPGINQIKLKADMDNKAIENGLKANFNLAKNLDLIGTPSFIFANSDLTKFTLVAGQTQDTEGDLRKALKEVR